MYELDYTWIDRIFNQLEKDGNVLFTQNVLEYWENSVRLSEEGKIEKLRGSGNSENLRKFYSLFKDKKDIPKGEYEKINDD